MPNRRQATIWTNADPINWRIYATLGGDELTQMFIVSVCKSLSTVWAPKSFIHQETYEHKITQNHFLPEYAYSAILHSNTPNKNISWTVKYLCKIPTAYVDYSLWLNVCILLCLRYSRCNSKLLSKINVFCLHIHFKLFLLKASWTDNLLYFLSIFKSLQVKIQACFSSQALPISFIQHSTTISNYWLK